MRCAAAMSIAEWGSSQFAGFALLAIYFGMFALSAFAGVLIARRTRRQWVGWLAGLAAFAGLSFLSGSTTKAIERVSCVSSSNYGACVDHDYGDSGY